MKILSTIFFLLFTGSIICAAQSRQEHYQVSPSAVDQGYITEKIWLNSYSLPEIKILRPVYSVLTALPEAVETSPADRFQVVLGMERKRPFAFIRIPVYSQNEQTGQLQLLTSFGLEIQEDMAVTPVAPLAKATASGSVLASGNWYKISVKDRGIYRIDHDFIQNKLGVNPSSITPSSIRIYGNGGVMLSESNAVETPDDLGENSIVVNDGGDGTFDQGDYILFYANGPTGWIKDSVSKTFRHLKNLYEDKSYFFINFDLGTGSRIAPQPGGLTGNTTVSSFNDYFLHEEDIVNLGRFGKEWWGEEFSTDPGKQSTRTFSFNVGNLTDSVKIALYLGAKSDAAGNIFSLKLNGAPVGSYDMGAVWGDDALVVTSGNFKAAVSGSTADLQLNFIPGVSGGKGYLNYLELNTRRQLALSGGEITFRDWNSVAAGNKATYQVQNANSNTVVWDITDPQHPIRMSGTLSGNTWSFTQDAAMLHEFVAFDGSSFHSPEFVKKTDNQDLHGSDQVDLIIVSYPDFLPAANKLADFHRQHDQMRVLVASTEQVYNEFSSGSQDIAAIRDLARMFYNRAGNDTAEMPRYLLLFGDASYDYKDRLSSNTNFVPTYETLQSVNGLTSYCSDDFFSFLDDNENIESTSVPNTMDIGVGRIPVATTSAANDVADKIINYKNPASLGPWRLSTTIISDYRVAELIHFEDGEIMGDVINSHSNLYNETKVHLAAIPSVSTPGGARAPEANKVINDQVYKGTFLMNYSGHGSTTTLSSWRILTQDDFNEWKNADKLPIMVTATCEFSKYDDPSYVSAGEKLMMKGNGGAIALLTTTQLVYQFQNRPMNVDYLNAQFQQYNGKWPSFGDAIRYGKNKTYVTAGSYDNFRKFVLLGDPALTASFPEHVVRTEAITDGNTQQPADSLKALGKYLIKGVVTDVNGQLLSDFNGRVYVTIYDKPGTVNLLYAALSYKVQNSIIYKGKATVTNGKFSFLFVAPKDLNYDFGKGKISYYAENGITDAAGADTSLTVGGFSDSPVLEDDAPIVKAFINDSLFKDGGITGSSTLLYAQLFDETGINVSGNSIGHDLTAVLDDDIQHPYVINDYYETAPNDYKKGYVYFPVSGLSDGRHSLRVKAWDMNNNSGEGTVNFEVLNGNIIKVQNLMNYPNPFRDITHFVFEHNHPGETLNIQINIYSTAGYLVRTVTKNYTPEGSRSNEITWDGTDNNGAQLPSGVYVYRMNIATEKGIEATGYQKLVIVR